MIDENRMKKHQLNYYFLRLFFSINLGFSLKKVKEEMKMNKTAVMLGLVGMGLGMAPTAAAAAEANPTASMTSQATLTIEQGILSLDQVTNFNFGTSSIQEIATDEQVIQTTSNEVTSITDYRGPNQAGWQLTAQLSKMTNASDNELANAKVTSLTVPKQNVNSGTYSGTITWTLANTYQAE